jgi:hypothetical protein
MRNLHEVYSDGLLTACKPTWKNCLIVALKNAYYWQDTTSNRHSNMIFIFSFFAFLIFFFFFYTHIGKTKSNKPNYKIESTGSIPLGPEEEVDA